MQFYNNCIPICCASFNGAHLKYVDRWYLSYIFTLINSCTHSSKVIPAIRHVYFSMPMLAIYCPTLPPITTSTFLAWIAHQSLSSAHAILSAGAERLKRSQEEMSKSVTPDFHQSLTKLRQNWRLRKIGNVVMGDLSYKSSECILGVFFFNLLDRIFSMIFFHISHIQCKYKEFYPHVPVHVRVAVLIMKTETLHLKCVCSLIVCFYVHLDGQIHVCMSFLFIFHFCCLLVIRR